MKFDGVKCHPVFGTIKHPWATALVKAYLVDKIGNVALGLSGSRS